MQVEPLRRETSTFPELLIGWRRKRRLSQLELALRAGISQRHVSFLESGRSGPSRSMLFLLCDTLEVPLRERNDWLVSAGFAPVFRARPLDDPQMARVLDAVRTMLANQEPYPAVAVDRAWTIRLANKAFERLTGLLGDDLWARTGGGGERNLMRLFFHPAGVRPSITNWRAIAPVLWQRAKREAESLDGREMQLLLSELERYQDPDVLRPAEEQPLLPVLPLEIERDGIRLSLFTTITTFGTAQDVTADELRIECFFAADDATAERFKALASRD
jgi:transcriptional regulator with XRE-family HTH domain